MCILDFEWCALVPELLVSDGLCRKLSPNGATTLVTTEFTISTGSFKKYIISALGYLDLWEKLQNTLIQHQQKKYFVVSLISIQNFKLLLYQLSFVQGLR